MSIVEYLLEEANANPLIKNNFEEAAYDVSAASGEAGEAYICEMLERAGSKWWHMRHTEGVDMSPYSRGATYDLLEFHVTVMVILHENQRSTSILGLSRPQFSPNALTKHDSRGPWSLHPSGIPSPKDQVVLPPSDPARPQAGSNWFWLTDWQIDYSDPRVDPTSGWQYARSFEERDEGWTPVAPTAGYGWVRRRRWVRVMKRRMDLAKGNVREEPISRDYLGQAEDLVHNINMESTETDPTRRMLQQLTNELRVYEEATQILLAGLKSDTNEYRKHEASILVKSHSEHTEKLNAKVSLLGSKLSTPVGPVQHNPELARELGFDSQVQQPESDIYVDETPVTTDFDTNPWSGAEQQQQQQQQQPWIQHNESDSSLNHVDLIGGHDAHVPVTTTSMVEAGPRTFTWESDTEARECRRCARRFGLLVRRHHCRRCGLIVCDKCSSSRTYLSPSEILQDPNGPFESLQVLASHHQRVCDKCYADLGTEGRA
ncbi:FYVE zinc finger-domain-containing protein [Fennellomyces sp. T-0311]|nr:FYVE zinc finger-domain-containing protein [Fennellomyces sp. T-0311]